MVYQSVKDYFKGQNILITGATGFIGKVLIEKLLRSCSGLDKIYVLVRMKKGKTPQERIADITNYPVSFPSHLRLILHFKNVLVIRHS